MLKTIVDSYEEDGRVYHLDYVDADDFEMIPPDQIHQVYGICFLNDKAAVVNYESGAHGLPGGRLDDGEDWVDGFKREIDEELSMEVIDMAPIGYQVYKNIDDPKKYQLRVACTVKPKSKQTPDPAGTVISFQFVEPTKVNNYIQYREVGDRMVERALEKLPGLKS